MNDVSALHLSVESAARDQDRAVIERGLMDHARSMGIDEEEQQRVALCLRDGDGALVGGAIAGCMWGWLEIRLFWIDETLRGRGHGTELLEAAEREGVRRGCHHVRLETFNPDALRFYKRRGYEQYGSVPDYPVGHTRYLLMKRLGL